MAERGILLRPCCGGSYPGYARVPGVLELGVDPERTDDSPVGPINRGRSAVSKAEAPTPDWHQADLHTLAGVSVAYCHGPHPDEVAARKEAKRLTDGKYALVHDEEGAIWIIPTPRSDR